MLYKVTNSGKGPRVIYTKGRRPVTIPVGQTMDLDLDESTVRVLLRFDGDVKVTGPIASLQKFITEEAMDEEEPKKAKAPAKNPPPPKETDEMHRAVHIPSNWKTLPWAKMRKLASQVSSDPIRKRDQAVAAIETELKNRKE